MDKYGYIMSESYEEIQEFGKYIVEYFHNDYLIIRDFLATTSPWDRLVIMDINNNHLELIPSDMIRNKSKGMNIFDLSKIKRRLLYEIFNTYTYCIIVPFLQEFDEEEEVTLSGIDNCLVDIFKISQNNPGILITDNYYMIRIMQFYVDTLNYKYDNELNIITYNKYKYDIHKIDNIITNLEKKYNIKKIIENYEKCSNPSDELKIRLYDTETTTKICEYIKYNFRTQDDVYDFVNYLFSLAYAYIIYQQEKDEELEEIEEDIIDLTESSQNLTSIFYSNVSVASQVLDEIHNNIIEFGSEYDLRHGIRDNKKKDILRDLDVNFDNNDFNYIMIHTYYLDEKLRKLILAYLIKNGSAKLFDVTMDRTSLEDSLYEYLFELRLDARNSNFYKREMIKKIVTDVFEYLNYKDKDVTDRYHYEKLSNLTNLNQLIDYYVDNYTYLITNFVQYNKECLYVHEKARFECIKNGDLKKIEKLYLFALDRYMEIIMSKYQKIEYIDDMNDIIDKLNSGSFSINISDLNKIMIYVYERLICEPSSIIVNDYAKEKMIRYIENREDYTYVESSETLEQILNVFYILATISFSYEDEFSVRKKIKSEEKIKILDKMKKHEQID